MPSLELVFEAGRFVLRIERGPGQAVALVLDQQSVERLCAACIRLLTKEGAAHPEPLGAQEPLLDYSVDALATGVDGDGLPLLEATIGNLRPLRLRFTDDMAALIVQSFSETLAAPLDVRKALRPN